MAFRQRVKTAVLLKLSGTLRMAIWHDRIAQVALHGNQDRAAETERDGQLTTDSMRHVHERDESHVTDALAGAGSCAVTGSLAAGTGRGGVEAMVHRTTECRGGGR